MGDWGLEPGLTRTGAEAAAGESPHIQEVLSSVESFISELEAGVKEMLNSPERVDAFFTSKMTSDTVARVEDVFEGFAAAEEQLSTLNTRLSVAAERSWNDAAPKPRDPEPPPTTTADDVAAPTGDEDIATPITKTWDEWDPTFVQRYESHQLNVARLMRPLIDRVEALGIDLSGVSGLEEAAQALEDAENVIMKFGKARDAGEARPFSQRVTGKQFSKQNQALKKAQKSLLRTVDSLEANIAGFVQGNPTRFENDVLEDALKQTAERRIRMRGMTPQMVRQVIKSAAEDVEIASRGMAGEQLSPSDLFRVIIGVDEVVLANGIQTTQGVMYLRHAPSPVAGTAAEGPEEVGLHWAKDDKHFGRIQEMEPEAEFHQIETAVPRLDADSEHESLVSIVSLRVGRELNLADKKDYARFRVEVDNLNQDLDNVNKYLYYQSLTSGEQKSDLANMLQKGEYQARLTDEASRQFFEIYMLWKLSNNYIAEAEAKLTLTEVLDWVLENGAHGRYADPGLDEISQIFPHEGVEIRRQIDPFQGTLSAGGRQRRDEINSLLWQVKEDENFKLMQQVEMGGSQFSHNAPTREVMWNRLMKAVGKRFLHRTKQRVVAEGDQRVPRWLAGKSAVRMHSDMHKYASRYENWLVSRGKTKSWFDLFGVEKDSDMGIILAEYLQNLPQHTSWHNFRKGLSELEDGQGNLYNLWEAIDGPTERFEDVAQLLNLPMVRKPRNWTPPQVFGDSGVTGAERIPGTGGGRGLVGRQIPLEQKIEMDYRTYQKLVQDGPKTAGPSDVSLLFEDAARAREYRLPQDIYAILAPEKGLKERFTDDQIRDAVVKAGGDREKINEALGLNISEETWSRRRKEAQSLFSAVQTADGNLLTVQDFEQGMANHLDEDFAQITMSDVLEALAPDTRRGYYDHPHYTSGETDTKNLSSQEWDEILRNLVSPGKSSPLADFFRGLFADVPDGNYIADAFNKPDDAFVAGRGAVDPEAMQGRIDEIRPNVEPGPRGPDGVPREKGRSVQEFSDRLDRLSSEIEGGTQLEGVDDPVWQARALEGQQQRDDLHSMLGEPGERMQGDMNQLATWDGMKAQVNERLAVWAQENGYPPPNLDDEDFSRAFEDLLNNIDFSKPPKEQSHQQLVEGRQPEAPAEAADAVDSEGADTSAEMISHDDSDEVGEFESYMARANREHLSHDAELLESFMTALLSDYMLEANIGSRPRVPGQANLFEQKPEDVALRARQVKDEALNGLVEGFGADNSDNLTAVFLQTLHAYADEQAERFIGQFSEFMTELSAQPDNNAQLFGLPEGMSIQSQSAWADIPLTVLARRFGNMPVLTEKDFYRAYRGAGPALMTQNEMMAQPWFEARRQAGEFDIQQSTLPHFGSDPSSYEYHQGRYTYNPFSRDTQAHIFGRPNAFVNPRLAGYGMGETYGGGAARAADNIADAAARREPFPAALYGPRGMADTQATHPVVIDVIRMLEKNKLTDNIHHDMSRVLFNKESPFKLSDDNLMFGVGRRPDPLGIGDTSSRAGGPRGMSAEGTESEMGALTSKTRMGELKAQQAAADDWTFEGDMPVGGGDDVTLGPEGEAIQGGPLGRRLRDSIVQVNEDNIIQSGYRTDAEGHLVGEAQDPAPAWMIKPIEEMEEQRNELYDILQGVFRPEVDKYLGATLDIDFNRVKFNAERRLDWASQMNKLFDEPSLDPFPLSRGEDVERPKYQPSASEPDPFEPQTDDYKTTVSDFESEVWNVLLRPAKAKLDEVNEAVSEMEGSGAWKARRNAEHKAHEFAAARLAVADWMIEHDVDGVSEILLKMFEQENKIITDLSRLLDMNRTKILDLVTRVLEGQVKYTSPTDTTVRGMGELLEWMNGEKTLRAGINSRPQGTYPIYSIGFGSSSLADIGTQLKSRNVRVLYDIRSNPSYAKYRTDFGLEDSGFVDADDEEALRALAEQFFADEYGIELRFAPELGGRPADGAIGMHDVRGHPNYANMAANPEAQARMSGMVDEADASQERFVAGAGMESGGDSSVAMICAEGAATDCHRTHMVAREIETRWGHVAIGHISPDDRVFTTAQVMSTSGEYFRRAGVAEEVGNIKDQLLQWQANNNRLRHRLIEQGYENMFLEYDSVVRGREYAPQVTDAGEPKPRVQRGPGFQFFRPEDTRAARFPADPGTLLTNRATWGRAISQRADGIREAKVRRAENESGSWWDKHGPKVLGGVAVGGAGALTWDYMADGELDLLPELGGGVTTFSVIGILKKPKQIVEFAGFLGGRKVNKSQYTLFEFKGVQAADAGAKGTKVKGRADVIDQQLTGPIFAKQRDRIRVTRELLGQLGVGEDNPIYDTLNQAEAIATKNIQTHRARVKNYAEGTVITEDEFKKAEDFYKQMDETFDSYMSAIELEIKKAHSDDAIKELLQNFRLVARHETNRGRNLYASAVRRRQEEKKRKAAPVPKDRTAQTRPTSLYTGWAPWDDWDGPMSGKMKPAQTEDGEYILNESPYVAEHVEDGDSIWRTIPDIEGREIPVVWVDVAEGTWRVPETIHEKRDAYLRAIADDFWTTGSDTIWRIPGAMEFRYKINGFMPRWDIARRSVSKYRPEIRPAALSTIRDAEHLIDHESPANILRGNKEKIPTKGVDTESQNMLWALNHRVNVELPLAPVDMIAFDTMASRIWHGNTLRKDGANRWNKFMKANATIKAKEVMAGLLNLWAMQAVMKPATGLAVSGEEVISHLSYGGAHLSYEHLLDHLALVWSKFGKQTTDDVDGILRQNVSKPRTRARLENLRQMLPDFMIDQQRVMSRYGDEKMFFDVPADHPEFLTIARHLTGGKMIQDDGFRAFLLGKKAFKDLFWDSKSSDYLRDKGFVAHYFKQFGKKTFDVTDAWDYYQRTYDGVVALVPDADKGKVLKAFKAAAMEAQYTGQRTDIPDEILRLLQEVRGLVPDMGQWPKGKLTDRAANVVFGQMTDLRHARIAAHEYHWNYEYISNLLSEQGYRFVSAVEAEQILRKELSALTGGRIRPGGIESVRNQPIGGALRDDLFGPTVSRGTSQFMSEKLFAHGIVTEDWLRSYAQKAAADAVDRLTFSQHMISPLGRTIRAAFPFGRQWFDMWARWATLMKDRPGSRFAPGSKADTLWATGLIPNAHVRSLSRIAGLDLEREDGKFDASPFVFLPSESRGPWEAMVPGLGPVPLIFLDRLIPDPTDDPEGFNAMEKFLSDVREENPTIGYSQGILRRVTGGGVFHRVAELGSAVGGAVFGEYPIDALRSLGLGQNFPTEIARVAKGNILTSDGGGFIEDVLNGEAIDKLDAETQLKSEIFSAVRKASMNEVGEQTFRFVLPARIELNPARADLDEVWLDAAVAVPDLFKLSPDQQKILAEGTAPEKGRIMDIVRTMFYDVFSPAERATAVLLYPQLAAQRVQSYRWSSRVLEKTEGEHGFESLPDFLGLDGEEQFFDYLAEGLIEPKSAAEVIHETVHQILKAREDVLKSIYVRIVDAFNRFRKGKRGHRDMNVNWIQSDGLAGFADEIMELTLPASLDQYQAPDGSPLFRPEELALLGQVERGISMAQLVRQIQVKMAEITSNPFYVATEVAYQSGRDAGSGARQIALSHIRSLSEGTSLPGSASPELWQEIYDNPRYVPDRFVRTYTKEWVPLRDEFGDDDPRVVSLMYRLRDMYTWMVDSGLLSKEDAQWFWRFGFERDLGGYPPTWIAPRPPDGHPLEHDSVAVERYRIVAPDTILATDKSVVPWNSIPGRVDPSRFLNPEHGEAVRIIGLTSPENFEEYDAQIKRLDNIIREYPVAYLVADPRVPHKDERGRTYRWLWLGYDAAGSIGRYYYNERAVVPTDDIYRSPLTREVS